MFLFVILKPWKLADWRPRPPKAELKLMSGNVGEWLTQQTSNLRIAIRMGSNLVRGIEQEILHSLLSSNGFKSDDVHKV